MTCQTHRNNQYIFSRGEEPGNETKKHVSNALETCLLCEETELSAVVLSHADQVLLDAGVGTDFFAKFSDNLWVCRCRKFVIQLDARRDI